MKKNKSSYTEVAIIAIGEIIVSALVVLGYFIASAAFSYEFTYRVFTGVLLGSAVTIINFIFLSVSVNRLVDEFIEIRGTREMDEEEAEKFLILCTDRRFTVDSCLAVYESDDGLTFTRSCEVRTNVGEKCHNCGIAGGPDRHVSLKNPVAVAYAYGSQWGYWGTRFQKAVIELTDEPDFSDAANPAAPWPVQAWPPH